MTVMDSLRGLRKMEGATDRMTWLMLGFAAGALAGVVMGARNNGNGSNGAEDEESQRVPLRERTRQRVDRARARVADLAEGAQQRVERLVGGDVPPDSPAAKLHHGLGRVATIAAPGRRAADADPADQAPVYAEAEPAGYEPGGRGAGVVAEPAFTVPEFFQPPYRRDLPPVRHLYPRV